MRWLQRALAALAQGGSEELEARTLGAADAATAAAYIRYMIPMYSWDMSISRTAIIWARVPLQNRAIANMAMYWLWVMRCNGFVILER